MMKRNHTRLCASAAIAAALVLAPTPLLAQAIEVAPVPEAVVPETPPPALPAEPSEPTVQRPPAETEPAAPVATTTTTATTTTPQRATPVRTTARTERTAVPTARTSTAAPASDLAPVAADETPDPVLIEPVAAPVASIESAAEPEAPAAAASDTSRQWAIAMIVGVLAVLLAIWGFIAIGRRKPVERRAAATIERPKVHHPAPIHAEPAEPQSISLLPATAPASSLAHTGAAIALPRTMPESFEERDVLLKRMIAARPDRANPFTSPIQRRKRAKLILQSLGRDFGDREPWIDLSQYPQNWPELANRKSVAA